MPQVTPKLHARGTYVVASPFTLVPGAVYECIAIRAFPDLVKEGIDILSKYYIANTLDLADFQADTALGANIITLASPNNPTIYIPDTYITSVPMLDTVAYSNVVLSISMGALPDALDLTFLLTQLAGACSDVIGVEPTVNIHIAPSTGVVTTDQHEIAETARLAAVTNRTTDHAKVLEQQNLIAALQGKITGLEAYIIEHLPPP